MSIGVLASIELSYWLWLPLCHAHLIDQSAAGKVPYKGTTQVVTKPLHASFWARVAQKLAHCMVV